MNLIYITGSSSGLGKALAELLLEDNNNHIVGIARRETIQHERYTHYELDLKEVINENIFQKLPANCEKVALINNAGAVGPITQVGSQSYQEVADNYVINITAPSFLCNQFVETYQNEGVQKIIINVSSGAGKHPIEAWSTYCASKSALDMFSQVLQVEHPDFKVFAVAPGIIDTPMQDAIRSADEQHFPHLDRFKSYKTDGDLVSAREVALKYLKIIQKPQNFQEVLLSVRDF
mgnify:CR=1 FL=1|tara:strand:+ start:1131 stop:1832 length:702 start_codon:yes stop_codon:yes gene_type:complete